MRKSQDPFANSSPPTEVELRIFRVKSGKKHHVRILSVEYGGLHTHWESGRSKYCHPDACFPKCRNKPRYWKGYTAAQVWVPHWNVWYPVVLEIPERAELDMRSQFDRGTVWEMTREADRKGSRSPVRAVYKELHDVKQLPMAFNIEPVLLHLYHLDEIDLTAPNPLPPLPVVEVSGVDSGSINDAPKEATPSEKRDFLKQLKETMNGVGGMPSDKD